jgi:hypothetical protein
MSDASEKEVFLGGSEIRKTICFSPENKKSIR